MPCCLLGCCGWCLVESGADRGDGGGAEEQGAEEFFEGCFEGCFEAWCVVVIRHGAVWFGVWFVVFFDSLGAILHHCFQTAKDWWVFGRVHENVPPSCQGDCRRKKENQGNR